MRAPSLWLCVGLALGLRLLLAVHGWDRTPIDDERAYEAVALGLLEGHGFATHRPIGAVNPGGAPTSLWGCLQPLYIAGIYGVFGRVPGAVYLANAALGLIPVLAAWRLGRGLAGARAAWMAGLWVAIDPHLVRLSASLMTEPLYTACLWLGIDCMVTWRMAPRVRVAALAGALFGLASLSRALAFPFALLSLLWIVVEVRGARGWWRPSVVFLASFAAVLAPWVGRNMVVHERRVFLDTKGGWNLYLYSHPEFDVERGNQVPLPPELSDRHVSESERSEILLRAAREHVGSDPWRLARQAPAKLWRLWRPIGGPETDARLALIKLGFLAPLELLAIAGIVRWNWRRAETRLLLLFLVYFASLHTLIPGGPRFRAPIDPVLAVFAGLAWCSAGRSAATQSRMSPSTPA